MDDLYHHLLRKLRLRHFELLGHLGEVGTVHAAAKRMHLTQPAVSRMIQEIEEIFGGPLFDRTARGISPNHIGLALMRRCGMLVAELAAAQQEATVMRAGASGLLRIGTFSGSTSLPQGVVELRRRMPNVFVQIREGQVSQLIADLLQGEIDCIVGALAPDELNNERLDQLRVEVLAEDRMCVVASRTHPLARRKKINWTQLAGQQWILPPRGSLLRRAVIAACLTEGITPPQPCIECLSPLTVLTLIRMDPRCIGPMRVQQAEEEVRINRSLVILDVQRCAAIPPLTMITRAATGMRELVTALKSCLVDSVGGNATKPTISG
ncbi:LysR substrate-binding domain-containing protein [Cupriavidus taiwanensis]|nr:LysR substrate-binding domain-containing protein [Cupriavidus taiwanensis]MDK3023159.1 LysR substrate-binding domain-containing protein [Cupriavidus taiwanensis]NSX13405.1 LysR family transcriptional regulator [Cupriavidus taiwanensis]